MNIRKVWGCLLLLMLYACCALAQQTTKKDGKAAKTEQKAAEAGPMKPAPEMVKFSKAFTGKFKVTGKIEDESWAPGGAEGSGTETCRRGPGGFSTISDSNMDFGKMGPFQGHGVMWWDAEKKVYTGIWCDNWANKCDSAGTGNWKGNDLVILGEVDVNGQKIPMRQTYRNITPAGFEWKMEMGDGKGGWKPSMSLKYDRVTK